MEGDPAQNDDARRAIAALGRENARLREDLASIFESSSWRLTRPLRRLRGSTRPDRAAPLADEEAHGVDPAEPDHPVPVRFTPGHYYSPMPDAAELLAEPRRSQIWTRPPREMPGVDWRDDAQLSLCRDVFARQSRLQFADAAGADPSEYFTDNGQYPALDAWLLEAILQWQRPARMIEIGSGFSSLVTARVNRELFGDRMRFTCVEPYPRQFLHDGVPGISDLIVAKVQDVPVEEFEALAAGDILFVDTSHTVKTGGDVPWIFHQILPRLAPGVLVHIHDAFLPGDYPERWVAEGWGWNETYLIHSFLLFNSEFEVVLGAQRMVLSHADVLAEAFPGWPAAADRGGAALWLRRRA